MSLSLGAILEPLGVAIHGSRRAALKPSAKVLIFGAGAVGLLCAAMAKVNGASHVIIADIQSDRVDFAVQNKFADAKIVVPMKRPQEIGEKLDFAREVAELVKEQNGGEEVDAVFECTGVESCMQASIYVSLCATIPFFQEQLIKRNTDILLNSQLNQAVVSSSSAWANPSKHSPSPPQLSAKSTSSVSSDMQTPTLKPSSL